MKVFPVALALAAAARACASFAATPEPAKLRFSGYDWTVQRFGPNCEDFSAAKDHVRLDARGLHLRATSRGGKRSCAEAASSASFGYGTYVFDVEAPLSKYDDNVVLGLFTYDADTAAAHREIDIEFSRWGDPKRPNGQYTVQPHADGSAGECGKNDAQCRFEVPASATRGVYSFRWAPRGVTFSARQADGKPLREWTETKQVPSAGEVPVKLNLWFFGKPRAGDQEAECVIRRFTFIPGP